MLPGWDEANDYWTDCEDENMASEILKATKCLEPHAEEFYADFAATYDACDDNIYVGKNNKFNADGKPISACEVMAIKAPGPLSVRRRWAIDDYLEVTDFEDLVPELVIQFPFELDTFQKRAIVRLHKNQHLLVCAHTGSGKTVVAEYAVALCLSRGQRAIYTSPIKALSNQKFWEFSKQFPSVGIITGDVCLNRDAQCLVMTTEILRNLLYRNDPVVNEIGTVVFDEVHYITDPERGVVWEECIILMPAGVTLALLSATVPNAVAFADWIGVTKQREVFIQRTNFRVVPLTHYIYFRNQPYEVMSPSGVFNQGVYAKMFSDKRMALDASSKSKTNAVKNSNAPQKHGGAKQARQAMQSFLNFLSSTDGLPAVIFCFSRNKCEQLAEDMSRLPSFSKQMEAKARHFFAQSLSGLSEQDRTIPQITFVARLSEKGIGIHHSGLLPVLKEITEILVSKGIIQVLFATETFAMGVNMPTRSVLMTALEKHDGRKMRPLTPGEYIQMAGRAGRRGIDEFGRVYIWALDAEPPQINVVYAALMNKPSPLESMFKLTMSMVLTMKTRSSYAASEVIGRSFLESERAVKLPVYKKRTAELKSQISEQNALKSNLHEALKVDEFCDIQDQVRRLGAIVLNELFMTKAQPELFCKGRIIQVYFKTNPSIPYYGIILSAPTANDVTVILYKPGHERYNLVDSLLQEVDNNDITTALLVLESRNSIHSSSGSDEYLILRGITIGNISMLYADPIQFTTETWSNSAANNMFSDLGFTVRPPKKKAGKSGNTVVDTAKTIDDPNDEAEARLRAVSELIGRIESSRLSPLKFGDGHRGLPVTASLAISEIDSATSRLQSNPCFNKSEALGHIALEYKIRDLERELQDLTFHLSTDSLILLPEFERRVETLISEEYLHPDGTPTIKGRVAVEIVLREELALAEAIFNNSFNDIQPAEIAVILSLFVYPGKTVADPTYEPSDVLIERIDSVLDYHNHLSMVLSECGVVVDSDMWESVCNPNFIGIAYRWATGATFTEIMSTAAIHEGQIHQGIVRLVDLTKKVRNVMKALGHLDLCNQMQTVVDLLSRDMIFMDSLYLRKSN